ncbi:MAG: VWA domain-containing protein, partial [Chloroflexi bacterium]|nr:VWA domain-containing protein [Chloroflexota bacterium]
LNAVRPDIGGVLIRGERGTAKSTAARALAALLPPVRAVAGCRFGCDPDLPVETRCDDCAARAAGGERLGVSERPTPFVDLPIGATEDRVVGTLDIQKVLASGERHFEPGLLAAANRGVLYVDEVNLLDDHVVDALLDAAAMGVNFVEREGVSFTHPARFILVGTMNPEEGDLRPQLTDRFGLSVEVHAVEDLELRTEILRRRLAFDADPATFAELWAAEEMRMREAVIAARRRLPDVAIRDRDLRLTAELVGEARVDGHRAELAILKGAQANAAFEGRDRLRVEDLALAARLALPHRMRRGIFEGDAADLSGIDAVLERFGRGEDDPDDDAPRGSQAGGPPEGGGGGPAEGGQPRAGGDPGTAAPGVEGGGMPRPGQGQPGGDGDPRPVAGDESLEVRSLDARLDRMTRRASGRRNVARSDTRRGRYVRAEPAGERLDDIAFDATLRSAAIRQAPLAVGAALDVQALDLQRKIRMRKTGNLVLFLVDASWSMATAERLKAAKGAVMSLLVDAYQRRDRVALAVFRRSGTRVVLPFTASVSMARQRLVDIAVGGKTPLSHALHTAERLFERELMRDPTALPLLVLLTDGAGNISLSGRPPAEEARLLSARLRARGVRSLVIDLYSQRPTAIPSPAADLARHLGGELCPVTSLQADSVAAQVRSRLLEGRSG